MLDILKVEKEQTDIRQKIAFDDVVKTKANRVGKKIKVGKKNVIKIKTKAGRVGKEKIDISRTIDCRLEGNIFIVEGTLGINKVVIPDFLLVEIDLKQKIVTVSLKDADDQDKHHRAMHGTIVRLIRNAVIGVTFGFKKLFIFKGLGYKFILNDDLLTLYLGYSMPIICRIPREIKGVALKDKLELKSINKEALGHFKSKLIKIRLWNPYSGKGIIEEGDIPYTKAVVKTKK